MIEEPLALSAPLLPGLALAVQSTLAAADTVVTVTAGPTGLQRWVDVATSIASIVIALALIVIAIPLVPAAWNSRRLYKRINERLDETRRRAEPILHHAEDIAENLNYVTSAVREDVKRLQATVAQAQERLGRAADAAEQRVQQFNALMEVVQDEAEDLFIGTASTVRGLRVGADAFARYQAPPGRAGVGEDSEERGAGLDIGIVETEAEPRRPRRAPTRRPGPDTEDQ